MIVLTVILFVCPAVVLDSQERENTVTVLIPVVRREFRHTESSDPEAYIIGKRYHRIEEVEPSHQ